jgi:hypothetical protein
MENKRMVHPWLGIDPIATAAQIIMEFKLLLAEI